MSDLDIWACFGGEEPEEVRELLDVVREPLPPTDPDPEALSSRVMAAISTRRGASSAAPTMPLSSYGAPRSAEGAPTVPNPSVVSPASAVSVASIASLQGPTVRVPTHEERLAEVGGMVPLTPSPVIVIGPAPEPAPPPSKPPALLKTAGVLEMAPEARAMLSAVPFVSEENAPKRAPRTRQSEVGRYHAGQTAPLDNEIGALARAVMPFPDASVGEKKRGAVTAEGEPIEGGYPLRAYVSLLVDLQATADRGAVLARYGVASAQALESLVALWKERAAREPEVEKMLGEAAEEYRRWLSGKAPR